MIWILFNQLVGVRSTFPDFVSVRKEMKGTLGGTHLSGVDHNISHHEASDEDRRCNDSGNPGIMLPELDMLYVMGNQFVDFES